jgi:hypothetical protein
MLKELVVLLPLIIAGEAFLAGVFYALTRSWGSALYWFSACTITIGVTLIPRWG